MTPIASAGLLLPSDSQYLVAQESGDDVYDPFTDFSNFESDTDEEAHINFLKNGRFFTMGFVGGYRGFTGSMAKVYQPNFTYGVYLSYFFDLRFALQIGYITGDHAVRLKSSVDTLSGSASINATSFNLKYFFNTQNVTRGLANLNPYLIGGLSNYNRIVSYSGIPGYIRLPAGSFDIGVGMEVPMMRNEMYFGVQAAYHLVNFKDENETIEYNGNTYGTVYGDFFDVLGILGINF